MQRLNENWVHWFNLSICVQTLSRESWIFTDTTTSSSFSIIMTNIFHALLIEFPIRFRFLESRFRFFWGEKFEFFGFFGFFRENSLKAQKFQKLNKCKFCFLWFGCVFTILANFGSSKCVLYRICNFQNCLIMIILTYLGLKKRVRGSYYELTLPFLGIKYIPIYLHNVQ